MKFTLFSESGGRRYLLSAPIRRHADIGLLVVMFLGFLASPAGRITDLTFLGAILLILLWYRFRSLSTEKLFSYGTLQQESVQRANFGRKLRGCPDTLVGWRLSSVRITDPKVLAESGLAVHKILVPGEPSEEVNGVVFEVTLAELKAADGYETAAYKRVRVTLHSGTQAWAYVSAA